MKISTQQGENKRAVIYVRVSTKEQADEGNSLVTQEKICREYSRKNGVEVIKVFVERGESAKTANRTELTKMVIFCSDKKNKITRVIVYKIDRLSRKTHDFYTLEALFGKYGARIESATEHIEDSPVGKLMKTMLTGISEFDNDVRTERVTDGMVDAVREGRYVWGAPVGYTNKKAFYQGKPTIKQSKKALLVKETFELIATNLYPTDEAWRIMVMRGLTTARSDKPVSRQYFHEMLRNRLYMGLVKKFGEEHWGKFKPIISKELFEEVQRVLNYKGHKVGPYRTDNPDFPLRRFVVSPEGLKLTGSFAKGKYPYYRFGQKGSNYERDTIDDKFANFMDSYAFNKSQVDKLKRFVKSEFSKATKEEEDTKSSLERRIKELEGEEDVLVQKNLKGTISDEILTKQLARIREETADIHIKLLTLNNSDVSPEEAIAFAEGYLRSPSSVWEDADIDVQIELQSFQFPSGVVFDGQIFGTNEICSVFKAKELISVPMSTDVDPRRFELLTSSLQMRRSTN